MRNKSPIPFEEEYVTINENNPINQYMLHFKAESAKVILFIHGGPGMSQSVFGYFLKEMFSDSFSLVFYDQRGAGRTLMKNPKLIPSLNVLLEDLQCTVNYLKKKYRTEKIVIMGHSWGSVLGYIYAIQYPEDVSHFVSIGQVCDMTESEAVSFQKLTQLIDNSCNKKDMKKIKMIGKYPTGEWNDVSMKLMGKVDKLKGKYRLIFTQDISLAKLARKSPTKFRLNDIVAMFKAGKVNSEMYIELMNNFLPQNYGVNFEMPILFIMGENDYVTPLEAFQLVYEKITSPLKKLEVLSNTGHMIPFEQPTEFASIVEKFIDEEHKADITNRYID